MILFISDDVLVIEGNNELSDNRDLLGWLGVAGGGGEGGGEGEEGDVVKKYSINSYVL